MNNTDLTLKNIIDDYNKVYVDMLTEKQREFVKDESRFKILQGVRQSGKSHIIKAIAFLTAIYERDQTIVIISFNLNSARRILEDIKQLYTSLILRYAPKVTASYNDSIEFDNGSRIMIAACNECSLHGLTVHHLLLDEIAFADEKKMTSLWESEFPILHCGERGKIVIVSTRSSRSKKNFFWRMWLGAVERTNAFKHFTLTAKDAGFSKLKMKNMRNCLRSKKEYEKQFTIRTK
jgi:hypothetical protein